MTTALLTVSNAPFASSRERLAASARAHGIAKVYAHDYDELSAQEPFFTEHRAILSHPRGLGYWLWKPFMLQKTLVAMEDGDVLIYADSGVEIIADLTPLVDLCKSSGMVLLFGNATDTNARWTRRDCFVYTGCDTPEYWHGPHCDASIVLVCKSGASTAFIDQWLQLCCNPAILTDAPNIGGEPNLPEFQDHRHDQSVLSLMAMKHRIALHRIPSQYGNHYKRYPERVPREFNCRSQWDQTPTDFYAALPYHNSVYGQLVNHHRTQARPPEVPPPKVSLPRRGWRRLKRYVARIGGR